MRVKDEQKQKAIIRAAIKVVNEIGFASASVSKIAKEAGVSPATIYVYYKNKEDVFVSACLEVKRDMSSFIFKNFSNDAPVRDLLETMWYDLFTYVSTHRESFQFKEQFSNSPFLDLIDSEELNKYFKPLEKTFERGVYGKILKDVDYDVFTSFMIHPVLVLANPRLCCDFKAAKKDVEDSFQMAWDAVKL